MDSERQEPGTTPVERLTSSSRPRNDRRDAAHQSYLLRLWRGGSEGEWRASLQSVQTGERHMFADLESLFAFLVEQAQAPPTV